jgi:hypothetical protein
MADANPKDFELSQSERIALMGLTTHPGWPVAVDLAARICRHFDSVSIKEEDDTKATKLRYEARAANMFSGLFIKIVLWNAQCGKVTEQKPKVKEIA